ncbi:Endo-1,3(4)-beta-glucanase [Seminavis robusta]|uniref:glucan endo-1,3-beta-D-glucosidase n=1 Tax=Seminavis robusta TaxID=568900 RepID=A0A9N8DQY6_9STRA|nr:Endo-1,3(4)-beta-glucanase [Seminavis robusta]|eukprot:Sro224_g091650.1 Endo-1,3(4)-beta-glucanase (931) ;mRNA; r:45857-48885
MAPRQSYGSITVKHEDEQEIKQLIQGSSSVPVKRSNSKKYFVIAILAIVIFVVVEFSYPKIVGNRGHAREKWVPQKHNNNKKANEDDANLILSELSPVDLGFRSIQREKEASPSEIWGNRSGPLPTNSWYLNLVSRKAAIQPDDSTRVYTVPYIVDMAPPAAMAGIRVHWPTISASDRNVQMVDDFKNGLCLGSTDVSKKYQVDPNATLSHLGVSLQWTGSSDNKSMKTSIVRGMPFVTMQYEGGALPILYSYNGPAQSDTAILVDGKHGLKCGTVDSQGGTVEGNTASVESEMQLHFIGSDFTWAVYFSKPVKVKCGVTDGDVWSKEFQLSVVGYDTSDDAPLITQVALINECTTGASNIRAHCSGDQSAGTSKAIKAYAQLMKEKAFLFPTSPSLHFSYPEDGSEDRIANTTIDWAPITSSSQDQLLMFAMPHHQEYLNESSDVKITEHCFDTFHGSTCLVEGNVWTLGEDLGAPMSFNAPRPPEAKTIPTLAKALEEDLQFQIPANLLVAAADTYFSGKILARVGRVISIAWEMNSLALGDVDSLQYDEVDDQALSEAAHAAASENFPSEEDIATAVNQLKEGVSAWLSEDAEAPYVFDKSWGGFVNCGCHYVGKGDSGHCNNTFPDCPALADVNEDFGNGWYNDHHYHYGYHVYAAAVVAKYDREWAVEYFDKVLLYIRDFANPAPAEEFFVQFRQKDWFLGSSWASGIVSAENSPHGRNEESSSEAIAAYEAVALYGAVMADIFSRESSSADDEKYETAKLVRDAGQLLTVTELRATNTYWHVWSSETHKSTYPKGYKQPVVGMLYDTMASFQTWFAPQAVVSYGIQLMPLTPVAERRDDPDWAAELYPAYEEACKTAGDFCINNGWSILQAGLCAEAGDHEDALEQALAIPTKVFISQGGDGNSLTNTIWFIATRKPSSASKAN